MERGRGPKVLGPKGGSAEPAATRRRGSQSEAGTSGGGSESAGEKVGRSRSSSSSSAPPGEEKRGAAGRGETPKRAPRKRGSQNHLPEGDGGVFASLQNLKGAPKEEQRQLFQKKMSACKVVLDFSTSKDEGEKEWKRQTLLELVEYANSTPGCFDEASLPLAMDMVGANLFRALIKRERSPEDMPDPEDDFVSYDEAWPHLEVVYEFFQRVVNDKQTDASLAAKAINRKFLVKLLDLFETEDPRERESLKTIFIKSYSRFAALRTGIRRGIHNVCLKAIHEGGSPTGIAELLEVLNRVIAGFSVPLKPEHRDLLFQALMPLHKLEELGSFHSQLVECLKKFVEKDAGFAQDIVRALLRCWPLTLAAKQLLFLGELEDMLAEVPQAQLPRVQDALARRLAACVSCPNSDVAERALTLCKNGRVTKLVTQHCRTNFPVVISALYGNATAHWAGPVHKLTFEVLKLLMETDTELFEHCSTKHRKEVGEAELRDEERERRWAALQQLHDRKRARSAARAQGRLGGGAVQQQPVAGGVGGTPRSPSRTGGSAPGVQQVLGPNGVLPLPGSRYGVIASWDSNCAQVELGFQALVVDGRGKIVGAVHDKNSLALQAAVWHTRSELEAHKEWFDSAVWLRLSRLPPSVALVVLVVVAYSGGHLSDVPNGVIRVVEEAHETDVAHFVVDPTAGDVGTVACIRRTSEGGWSLVRTEAFVRQRRHFMDILEPTLGRLIREMVPGLPKRHRTKLAFTAMEQGAVGDLPQPAASKWLFVGVGWDITTSAMDVSVSAVFFGADGADLGAVSASSPENYGARHCGGGLLGSGVNFDLDALPQDVSQVLLLANLRKEGSTFDLLQKPYCCVVDPAGAELLRYTLAESPCEPGLILARLFREASRGRWGFQALGAACGGRCWKQSLEEARSLVCRAPDELQVVPDEVRSASDSKRSIVSL